MTTSGRKLPTLVILDQPVELLTGLLEGPGLGLGEAFLLEPLGEILIVIPQDRTHTAHDPNIAHFFQNRNPLIVRSTWLY